MATLSFEKLRDELKTNGIVFVRDFISKSDALEIKKDIADSVQQDMKERQEAQQLFGRFVGSSGITHNNQGKHIITDYFGRSDKLDQAMGKIFADENVSKLLKFIGGDHLKLRGYNTRRMNGPLDYSAMEWHRDNYGEFTIGVVLDEAQTNDSATSFIPGSHMFPYCPFVKAQFQMPTPIAMPPKHERFFSSLLEKKTTSKAQYATGKPGDIYIFMGDLWHGRNANKINNNDMVFFIGLFPSEIPFPSHAQVDIPAKTVLDKLPSALRAVVDFRNTPANPEKTSYFYELQKQKPTSYGALSLWNLAEKERIYWKNINEFLEEKKESLDDAFNFAKNFFPRVVRKIRRILFRS